MFVALLFFLCIFFFFLFLFLLLFFYAPNFKEVEGAYWFGSVRAVCESVCLSVMRE